MTLADRCAKWTLPPLFKTLETGQVCEVVDVGIRHKSGAKPTDYLKAWLNTSRQFGYATNDGSWGEFEKEFSIMVRNYVELIRQSHEAATAIEAGLRALEGNHRIVSVLPPREWICQYCSASGSHSYSEPIPHSGTCPISLLRGEQKP